MFRVMKRSEKEKNRVSSKGTELLVADVIMFDHCSTERSCFTLQYAMRNEYAVSSVSVVLEGRGVIVNRACDAENERIPWFFDKNLEIRLALFFEMRTMIPSWVT